jgi:hypothetical protein
VRVACQVLQVSELRIYRWLGRRAAGELADQAPGGSPVHGLLDWEVTEVVRLFAEWGELDRKARQAGLEQARLQRRAWHREHRQSQPSQEPGDAG